MRLSLQTLRLLSVFLEEPTESRYGLELMRRTSLKSGTIYPALHRLEAEGWLRSWNEELDASAAGRPPRRLYALTETGAAAAQAAVQPFRAPPAPARIHPTPRTA
jgi:DNA-binding PadR family transcriptional regulator